MLGIKLAPEIQRPQHRDFVGVGPRRRDQPDMPQSPELVVDIDLRGVDAGLQ